MTNLTRWLMYGGLFAAIYFAIVTEMVPSLEGFSFGVQIGTLSVLFLAGVYAVCTVLYRTFTINDSNAAGEELIREIQEARRDLAAKGFKFRDLS